MLWEIEIEPIGADSECDRVRAEFDFLIHDQGTQIVRGATRGYLVKAELQRQQANRLLHDLLLDPLVEKGHLRDLADAPGKANGEIRTVLLKPGVMDAVAQSVLDAARDLGLALESVQTFRRYYLTPQSTEAVKQLDVLQKLLANDAVEQFITGELTAAHWTDAKPHIFQLVTVPVRELDDAALQKLSRTGQLSLNLHEMQVIQNHFRRLDRDPTDIELETLAQTWSEHCSHKTLKGQIEFHGRRINNLLKETIFGATQEIRQRHGDNDWCVSVFEDNAGIVRFDDHFNVCFKVETHNHPSAIEPYGGANTGLGGVIRDPMGTGLGAKPICNTDVFCFAPPDTPPEELPPGVLHPKRVMKGVVAGVRDYGNRMGIPTVNGAVCFDPRYLANPLVFCGTVGLIPVDKCHKEPKSDDLIVAIGGRTGRDGIHGATFSSIELTADSESVSGGAVQIGNAITEKKLLDVLLQARDRGLYNAVTDCGAGGFSSAVGEMGEKMGAVVHLEKAPLKYQGLTYTEIWISEAQERMILAVPPASWQSLKELCESEGVEATVIGHFEETGKLRLFYEQRLVADLEMDFLHNGRPAVLRKATWRAHPVEPAKAGTPTNRPENYTDTLLKILSSLNVCSKEWIIRQYDHEVQGGSVIKPLVGIRDQGPSDAAVITPVLGSWTGLAIGCGINPHYGEHDPYAMAAAAIDEAVRNVVAVGADPSHIALLDNFCWGNTDRPEVLGSLVRAAEACHDVALAYMMPFISGKDSLNNEYHSGDQHIVIPPTLLISALGRVPDVRQCVTMDLKEPGNELYLIGLTKNELGGSHYNLATGQQGGLPPGVEKHFAPVLFRNLHQAIRTGLVRSCHDLSEGGLAAALAEMAFAGGIGADVATLPPVADSADDAVALFSESTSRFVVEVRPDRAEPFRSCMGQEVPMTKIGRTCKEGRLRIAGRNGEWIIWAQLNDLQEAWQKPLRW